MWITNSIEITIGDHNTEILLGFYNQAFDGFPIDDKDEIKADEEPIRINRFVIGLLLFNIGIYYR